MIQDTYDCIIVGGGLGGTVMASLLALYDIKVLLVEKNGNLGGYITDYKVKDYTFSHSIDWFSGLHDKGKLRIWLEKIHMMDKFEFTQLKLFKRIITKDYNVGLYCDFDKTAEELADNFPNEKEHIYKFIEMIKSFGGPDWINYFRPFKNSTFIELLDFYFKDNALKTVLSANLNDDMSAYLYVLFLYRCLNSQVYCLSELTLHNFFDMLEETLVNSGVTVLKNTTVDKIFVSGKSVTGVLLSNGQKVSASGIITDIDLKYVYNNLLPPDCVNNYFMKKLNSKPISGSLVSTFMGVNKNFSDITLAGEPIVYVPTYINDDKNNENPAGWHVKINIRSILQPFLAPTGKSAIDIRAFSTARYFNEECVSDSYGTDEQYLKDKAYFQDQLVSISKNILGNYEDKIECIKTATPYTFQRYFGGKNGTPMGWMVPPSAYVNGFRVVSPINNLFHVGCWASFPGIEGVVNYCSSILPRLVKFYGKV